jgi:hypothetical protein
MISFDEIVAGWKTIQPDSCHVYFQLNLLHQLLVCRMNLERQHENGGEKSQEDARLSVCIPLLFRVPIWKPSMNEVILPCSHFASCRS